jgi:hypothetical protein
MKTLIILGLLALVFSYPSFLRELQDDSSNDVASTDSSDQHEDDFEFNMELFNPAGSWTLVDTTCAHPEDELCVFTAVASFDERDHTHIIITITYPDDRDCGDFSGQDVSYKADYYIGQWSEEEEDIQGAYRINNETIVIYHNDTFNPEGGRCVEYWSSRKSSNTLTPATEKLWEGVWQVYKTLPIEEGEEDEYCCIPKDDILVTQDLDTETIVYSWRAPDCDSCENLRSKVFAKNISIVGGGGYEDYDGVSSYIYAYHGHLIVQFPKCAYLLEPIPVTSCDSTPPTTGEGSGSTTTTGGDSTTTTGGDSTTTTEGDSTTTTEGDSTTTTEGDATTTTEGDSTTTTTAEGSGSTTTTGANGGGDEGEAAGGGAR